MNKSKTQCDHWFFGTNHDFDRWVVFDEGKIVRKIPKLSQKDLLTTKNAQDSIGKYILQKRICNRCGFTEMKEQLVLTVPI